ncbi:mannosyltransferase YkcB-related protein [Streptomyces gibsoniae]|uniref:glycosyltransferase family 39 protein n=1 Tax=Streptomyces gibsoniae TaxID=3075529 RepID=UPI00374E024D
MATTVLDLSARPTSADRRAPWRSPVDQPVYARPALLVITVLAAVLYTWGIEHSQYHTFYANAARSMTESWKAFFYGSFDPGNSITLDKLPGFLWPQALSARIFGFHPWALTLPQVIEGVASLLVLHRLVRRWAGVPAALIASTAFLLTPVAVGLFRTAVEDPAFTLCVLLAAEATQRAARNGRLRPLMLAGVWVGLGFQAKMLEAWAVLPALALVYLMAAPIALRKRLAHLGLSALVMTAVSASWMLAVTLTPGKDRPYVDGTTNNSAFSMVVGYNFLNRFSSLGISAASTGSVSATQGGGGGHGGPNGATGANRTGQGGPAGQYGLNGKSGAGRYGGSGRQDGALQGTGQKNGTGASRGTHHRHTGVAGAQGSQAFQGQAGGQAGGSWAGAKGQAGGGGGLGGGQNGWSKMFGTALASQTGWLYPIAAVALVCGLLWRRGKPRTDRIRSGFALWGTWLITYFMVFSAGSVGGHTYYMGVIAVPLAALTGGGVALMWRAYRAGGRRAWVLPAAVAATATWSAYLAGEFPSFLPWLAPVVGVLGLIAVVLLVLSLPGRAASGGRLALAGLAASLAAVLIAPSAWAVQIFNPSYGSSGMGAVGPSGMNRGHRSVTSAAPRIGQTPWGGGTARDIGAGRRGMGGFGGFSEDGKLTASQRKLLDYTTARQGSAAYVFATTSWNSASPYILGAGAHVLPLGGFSGQVPFPTETQFRQLVSSGKLQYVLLGGGRGMGSRFGGGTTTSTEITDWVRSTCTLVPATAYGGSDSAGAASTAPDVTGAAEGDATAQTLYRCVPGQ